MFRCPLCDQPLDEAARYSQHLAEIHGLVDDPGTTSTTPAFAPIDALGAPVAPPEPTPTSTLPPPPVPVASAPATAHGRTFSRGAATAIAIGSGVLVLTVLLLVAGTGSHSTSTSNSRVSMPPVSTEPTTPTTPTQVSAPVDPVFDDSSGPDSVDVAEAGRVARKLWDGEVRGMHDHRGETIRTITSGPMLETDLGYLRDYDNGCTGPCWHAPLRTIDSVSVNVPHQSEWPAAFLATVKYTSSCKAEYMPCVDLFVARQEAKGAPWTMHLFVSYGGHFLSEDPALLPDGFAEAPTLGVPADTSLLDDYADYRGVVKRTGASPSAGRFLPGPFTTGLASQILTPDGQKRLGITEDVIYRGDSNSGMFVFATGAHTATTCGVIRYSADDTALPGRTITADVARFIGDSVPPGDYVAIHSEGLQQVCFETYPPEAAMPEQVVATNGTSTLATGTHA